MPTQVVQTIDLWFPHAKKNEPNPWGGGNTSDLLGVLNLLKDVPDELFVLESADYADLILAKSAIDDFLTHTWRRGNVGGMSHVRGFDAITVIRRVLAKCPDEYPPLPTTELLFIENEPLRDNIRRDMGAINRALHNAEWKAATVLAGAAIEALLHWRLQKPSPGDVDVQAAAAALVASRIMSKPDKDIDRWELHHFIEVAARLGLLTPDTCSAVRLAKNFRNLIHPGRAARLAQTCDRATAYSATGALEHVMRELSQV
jgi:hypothetical protein